MRVVWSARAAVDLREIIAFLREQRPSVARRIGQQIRNAVRRLARFPLSGRILPEFPTDEYRELIVRDYRVIYRLAMEQVRIVTVVHGRRDVPSVPFQED